MIRAALAAALLLAAQDKAKPVSMKDALAAVRPQAIEWDAGAWLARVEALATDAGSVDASGRFPAWKISFARRTGTPGELETRTWHTLDGGASWSLDDPQKTKVSFGWMPIPDKVTDPKGALAVMKKAGIATTQPSLQLLVERGAPVWVSTTPGQPVIVVDAIGGKILGEAKRGLPDLLDGVTKTCDFPDAMARVSDALKSWGIEEWGLAFVEGRAAGVRGLGQALHLRAWTITVETKKPVESRVAFGVHNATLSGWDAQQPFMNVELAAPGSLGLAKASGYVSAHPLIVDWARGREKFTVHFEITTVRLKQKEARVRLVDEAKTDEWAQAVLDTTTGKIKEFLRQ